MLKPAKEIGSFSFSIVHRLTLKDLKKILKDGYLIFANASSLNAASTSQGQSQTALGGKPGMWNMLLTRSLSETFAQKIDTV